MDLRVAINAISDVVTNRPPPLREFDQIYMKVGDMLLQAELLGRWFDGKSLVCIGDGDAIGLTLMHLAEQGILKRGPSKLLVLDFDERIVNSVRQFSKAFGIGDKVSSQLYNVADPLPSELVGEFDGFYTNPPYGRSNGGRSVESFTRRGLIATADSGLGAIVLGDDPSLQWTQDVLKDMQKWLILQDVQVSELVPAFSQYHLDDEPELTSCTMIVKKSWREDHNEPNDPLDKEDMINFYGLNLPLKIKYVRDRRKGGVLPSSDYQFEEIVVE